jgi:hypothetical protein
VISSHQSCAMSDRVTRYRERMLPIALQVQLIVADCRHEYDSVDPDRMRAAFERLCRTLEMAADAFARACFELANRSDA